MLGDKTHRSRNLTAALLALMVLIGAGCSGSDEAASSVASLADVEVAATPTPASADDPPEADAEAQDPGSAETSADPTDTTGSEGTAHDTNTSTSTAEDPITEDATDEEMALAFVACMREAGIDEMPDPTVLSDGTVQLLPPGPQREILADPAFEEASQGCVDLIEDATFFSAAQDTSAIEDSLLEFAQCLRDNDVDVDDPDLSRFVPGQGARMFGDDFDPQDPANAEAIAACQHFLPNAGGN